VEARFEEIRRKYKNAKCEENNIDLLTLKREIELMITDLRASEEKNDDLMVEAQDMLIDLIKIVEEGRCQPFRPKKL